MLYQSYKEKLNKRRLMFDRIWKFRLLILAGLLIALAAVGAMLGIKGIVSDFTISESFTYGNPLNPSANCIFGKAGFEYREVGESEWTDEAPVLAGEYECRPTGRTIVGSNRTGDIKTFTIEPIDTTVTVVEDHLVYGEVPEFSAKLQYSDVLSVDSYSLERPTKDRVEIEFSAEDIRILSADGDDVTASYNITAVDKTLTASLRPVTVETPSASYVYDGQVHGTEGAEITSARGLVKGHKLEISTISEYDKVGTYANSVQSMRIVDENGEDVSEWYNLTVVTGTLQITKRPITVGAELEDIVYDGLNHVYDQLQLISGSLAKGQQFSLTNYRTARDVGTYANTTDIVILDENGNNVNSNYSITRNFPTMKIISRPLSVSTQSAEFTYDGLDHIYNTVDIAADVSLAQGQEIHYMNPIYCKAVGEYDISPSFRIWDENGYDVTGNYAITRNFGKVKILPRKIKVTTDSEDFVYDGKYHNYDKVDLAEGDGLASEQEIRCVTITCRDVGEYDISPSFSILDALGYNVTNNYEITREFGKVTIRPLAINLGTPSFEFIYDGEEHKYSEIDIAEGYRLAEDQKINIDKTIVCENVGTYDNSPSFRILDNNNSDVTKNYAIIRNFGKITIQQKKLVIKTKSDTIYYDGLEHRYDYGAQTLIPLDGTSLASGDMFSFTSYPTEMTKANETGYINFPAITIRSGGRDVSSNYDFSVREYGTIKIMRRNLEVTTGTASELIYNGGPQSCEDFDVNATDSNGNGLAAGQRIEVVGATSRTDCCNNVKNELQVQILDSSGRDVAENYNAIQWTYGTITINPRPISFNILGDSWIYDGQSHSIEQLEPINIVSGHTFTFKRASALPTITDVGSKINSYTFGDVQIFESGRDVTSNYTIDTVEKSVEDISVTPRAVTLKTESDLRCRGAL